MLELTWSNRKEKYVSRLYMDKAPKTFAASCSFYETKVLFPNYEVILLTLDGLEMNPWIILSLS